MPLVGQEMSSDPLKLTEAKLSNPLTLFEDITSAIVFTNLPDVEVGRR